MKVKLIFVFILALCTSINAQTNYVLNFNGTSDYVDMGSSAANNLRSVEFWFKPSVNITSAITDPSYVFIGRNDASQLHEYGFFINGNEYAAPERGLLDFYLSDNGNYYYTTSNSSSWTAGIWYHVCGTIDPATGMKLYINGVLQSATTSYTTAIPAANEITALGRWGDAAIRYFPGRMDELRLWNRAITQAEVQQKMCSSLIPANETGLVGYWKMNEGSGTTIFDATSNSNNGTLNTPVFVVDSACSSPTTSINKFSNKLNAFIFPNPASSTITVSINQLSGNSQVFITNMLGETVYQSTQQTNSAIIDVSNLSNGIYLVNVKTTQGVTTTKIIINR
jgi:hypothetical protein